MVDFIGNGCPIADYKAGFERFSGVGSANSKAANSDFWAGVISVKPLSVLRISAIVDTCFRLNVDGVSEPSWTRRGCAQARG